MRTWSSHKSLALLFKSSLLAVTVTACETTPGANVNMPRRVTEIDAAKRDGKVAVRVGVDSSGQRLYAVGPREATLGLAGLATELVDARKTATTIDTVYLYTEPGARGFDVLMALKAAKAAGFTETVAWADYSFADPSKSEPKRWTQSLSRLDGMARTAVDSGPVSR